MGLKGRTQCPVWEYLKDSWVLEQKGDLKESRQAGKRKEGRGWVRQELESDALPAPARMAEGQDWRDRQLEEVRAWEAQSANTVVASGGDGGTE